MCAATVLSTAAVINQAQAWRIDGVKLEVLNFTTAGTQKIDIMPTFEEAQRYRMNTKGVRFSILISRTSK
jgi:hypothetical protein